MGKSQAQKNAEAAVKKYDELSTSAAQAQRDNAKKTADWIIKNQKAFVNNVKNSNPYQSAFKQAQGAAEAGAAAQGAQAQNAARQAGMSKAQAAEMGANTRQQGYNQTLQNQQNMAQNAEMSKLGMQQQSLGNQANAAMQGANMTNQANWQGAQNKLGYGQAAMANDKYGFEKGWGWASPFINLAGDVGSTLLSDANCKDLIDNNIDESDDPDEFDKYTNGLLKKMQNLEDLIIQKRGDK